MVHFWVLTNFLFVSRQYETIMVVTFPFETWWWSFWMKQKLGRKSNSKNWDLYRGFFWIFFPSFLTSLIQVTITFYCWYAFGFGLQIHIVHAHIYFSEVYKTILPLLLALPKSSLFSIFFSFSKRTFYGSK